MVVRRTNRGDVRSATGCLAEVRVWSAGARHLPSGRRLAHLRSANFVRRHSNPLGHRLWVQRPREDTPDGTREDYDQRWVWAGRSVRQRQQHCEHRKSCVLRHASTLVEWRVNSLAYPAHARDNPA
eukprot:3461598-Prymnesium_polylepis.2